MNGLVSRAGEKLEHALKEFDIKPSGYICADFGASTGGFTQALLNHGAVKVYAVEIAYGELDWNLRRDERVVVLERTNAMHVTLPEKVDLITIDVGWTKQIKILPNVLVNLKAGGTVISLIKPHYESPKEFLRGGKLMEEKIDEVIEATKKDIKSLGIEIVDVIPSPILGDKGKNREFLALLKKDN